jgi:hypothetical protein
LPFLAGRDAEFSEVDEMNKIAAVSMINTDGIVEIRLMEVKIP